MRAGEIWGRSRGILREVWRIPYLRHPILGAVSLLLLLLGLRIFLLLYTRHGQEFELVDYKGHLLDSAQYLSREQGVRLVVLDSVYILTRRPGEIIAQEPKAHAKVKRDRRVFLTVNAKTPQLLPAPNLVGNTLRQALIDLERSGFEVGQLTFTPDIAVRSVLGQYYKGREMREGDSIPKGGAIDLRLGCSFESEYERMPQLLGLTLREARARLAGSCLNVGNLRFDSTVQTLADSLSSRVYGFYPKGPEGERMELGARVDLWLTLNDSRIETQ